MTGRLIHTGQVVADLVLRIDQLPPRGGDVVAADFLQTAGGGFNVMAAARRAGADVVYAGSHGRGPYGDLIRDALAAEGIHVAHPVTTPDSGVSVALVEAGGERTFVTSPDAVGRFRGIGTEPGDFVYLTGYSLTHEHNAEALLTWLPGARGTVLLDPGPLVGDIATETWNAVLPHVDILSSNAAETRALADADVAVRILRDGANGCRIVHGDGRSVHVPGFPVTAVDTNGAGDAHCGVLAAELLRGNDLTVAAKRANAAAAIAVTRPGPATAPSRAEVDALVDRA
ncbi:PfkB family carbohydrate kinase [Kibdelosporangium phytohabitans]|uniref:Sugar kinase n=1 Tax=Kibdelosporangium phytohabitans TaxID=860235 RepID=A0A0N9I8R1_9PSEU|nr:PfkB family carbohydrate kinase [Kibdelosporangium phytohabitans]ALG11163.1 sugar kinase [Kibdelosporangium phytohabitans]MBE1462418.1 sugar/nucleoside kinase (ribokinase family) [Kibdelosporangium phytohabitans]